MTKAEKFLNKFRLSDKPNEEACLFFDTISGQFFWKNKEDVVLAELYLNKMFVINGEVSLNDFYTFLDIPTTEYGKTVGWSAQKGYDYGYMFLEFEHTYISLTDDSLPDYYAITPMFQPTADYQYY